MLKKKSSTPLVPTKREPATDALTGLPTRASVEPWLTALAERSTATSQRMALLFLSLRDLDDVNDTFGPDEGDRLLGQVAKRLADGLESHQKVARYSGAEFAIVSEGVGTTERARDTAEAIFELLAEPFAVGSGAVNVSASIGVALSDPGYSGVKAWLDDAHHALAEAREEGNRSIVVHDESTRNRINVQINEERVEKAFKQREFVIVYQPIVVPADGSVVGFEALLRWLDPSSGGSFITPSQFLPLLEKTGLITPVGTWAIQEATEQIKLWNDGREGQRPFFVSVNLGAKQIAQPDFAGTVAQALDACGLEPELLTLDVTPAAIRYHKSATWGALRDLKYLGIRIALDDFGVGDSSMTYLRELNIDLLRIDRQFIDGLGNTPEDTAIVRHVINLGRELGIITVAEGVEREQQDQALREFNCPLAQGWYYGRPEPAATIEDTLLNAPPA
jgi:diguanylate cyclase (GGDEF)-like protein